MRERVNAQYGYRHRGQVVNILIPYLTEPAQEVRGEELRRFVNSVGYGIAVGQCLVRQSGVQ